jgi:Amt family ammonium transporter
VGGTVGALLTGVYADKAINGVFEGALYGKPAQLGIQALAVGTANLYSGAASIDLLKLIGLVMPLRATAADEATGLDVTMHGEEAYLHAGGMEAFTHPEAARPAVVPAGSPVAVQ